MTPTNWRGVNIYNSSLDTIIFGKLHNHRLFESDTQKKLILIREASPQDINDKTCWISKF